MRKDNSYTNASFSLVRTNPLLTGNIKLTVSSDNKIWFNSINANDEMSKDTYKKYPINLRYSHPANIMNYLNKGRISTDILYDVYKSVDPTRQSNDFKDQYDFSLYFSGVKYLSSNQYDEKFSYFSPLYIKNNDIPEHFVIFKINGPINHKVDELKSLYPYSNDEYMSSLLDKCSIIKTFDLRTGTIIGDYLRNIVSDKLYPSSPMSVNFNENEMTYWKGVDVKKGIYSEIGEYLYDFYSDDVPIKYFDKYISEGFKRHGLLFPNIVNLEFLFNDDTSNIFDHNRYLGLYVNSFQFDKLTLDIDGHRTYQNVLGNSPTLDNVLDQQLNYNVLLYNDNGVNIKVLNNDNINLDYTKFKTTSDQQIIPYIKDKNNQFYNIKDYYLDNNSKLDYINLSNAEINLRNFAGNSNNVYISDNCTSPTKPGKSFLHIKMTGDVQSSNELIIYHNGGSQMDETGKLFDSIYFSGGFGENKEYGDAGKFYNYIQSYNNYDVIYTPPSYFKGYWTTLDSNLISNPSNGDYYIISQNSTVSSIALTIYVGDNPVIFNSTSEFNTLKVDDVIRYNGYRWEYNVDVDDKSNKFYVGINGANGYNDIIKSLAECILSIPTKSFDVFYLNDELVIVNSNYGDFDDSLSARYISKNDDYNDVSINGYYGSDIVKSKGGSLYNNILLIDVKHYSNIKDSYNSYLVRTKDGKYSKIQKVTQYAGDFYRGMKSNEIGYAFDTLKNKICLVLDKNEIPLISSKKCEILDEFKPEFGVLSFYNVKDFDFDYYSNRYSKFPYWETWRHFYIPNDTNLLKLNNVYLVLGDGEITYNHVNIKTNNYFICNGEQLSYSIVNGDPIIIPWFYFKTNESFDIIQDLISNVECDECYTLNYNDIVFIHIKFSNIDIVYSPLHDMDVDIKAFPGFFNIYDSFISDSNINTNTDIYKYKNKYTDNILSSEYDYLKENYNPNFAYFNKMVQSSCKWAYLDGYDIRNNPYRLNNNLTFGVTNFAPTHVISEQVPKLLTHEWYYIVSDYDGIVDIDDDNYCYITDGFNLVDINANPTGFIDKFTFKSQNKTLPQYRYSIINYNNETGECETFFRGVKLIFRELKSNKSVLNYNGEPDYVQNSRKYDNYKFSVVLNPIKEVFGEDKPPIEMIINENAEQKFILYVINLYINHVDNVKLIADKSQISDDVIDAGGNVNGVLRYSISWNEFGDSQCDFDAHCIEPNGNHIYYANKNSSTSGSLDVDSRHKPGINVENIIWTDLSLMPDGEYKMYIRNFTSSPYLNTGFNAEIEYGGNIFYYKYDGFVGQGVYIDIAIVTLNNGEFSIQHLIPISHFVEYNESDYFSKYRFSLDKLVKKYNFRYYWDGSGDLPSDLYNNDYVIISENSENKRTDVFIDLNNTKYDFPLRKGDYLIYKTDSEGYNPYWVINENVYHYMELYDNNPKFKIDGDYKISFNELNISDITYTMLYSLKHKKISIDKDFYSNIKIPSNLDLNNLSNSNSIYVNLHKNMSFLNYDYDLSSEISNYEYNNILMFKDVDNVYGIHISAFSDQLVNLYPIALNPLTNSNSISVNLTKPIGYEYNYDVFSNKTFDRVFPKYTTNLMQLVGGKNYYTNLFKKLSFSKIKKYINTYSNFIEYKTYTPNGYINSNYYIKVIDDSIINKTSIAYPSEIKDGKVIGYNLVKGKLETPYPIYRYQGKYSPIFVDVLFFDSKITGLDEFLPNCKFASDYKNFGILENFNHLKISNSNIFKYTSSGVYNVEYELIDEINVGQKDLSVLHTSWDYGFHQLYTKSNEYTNVSGALRIEEDDTFINNVIILPDVVNLTQFDSELVDDITLIDMSDKNIVYQIADSIVTGKINIENVFIDKLIDLGIGKSFDEYLKVDNNQSEFIGNLTLDEYIKLYTKINVLPIYDVFDIDVYLNKINSLNKFSINNMDFDFIDKSLYVNEKDIQINKDSKYILNFRYNQKVNHNSELNFTIKIKLI